MDFEDIGALLNPARDADVYCHVEGKTLNDWLRVGAPRPITNLTTTKPCVESKLSVDIVCDP
jgi:hypothetical protein